MSSDSPTVKAQAHKTLLLVVALTIIGGCAPVRTVSNGDIYQRKLTQGDGHSCNGSGYRDAVKLYRQAEAFRKNAEVALRIGECHRKAGKCKSAVEAYDNAIFRDGKMPGPRIGKALCILASHRPDYATARKLLTNEDKLSPGRAEVTVAIADIDHKLQSAKAAQDKREKERQEAKRQREATERKAIEAKAKLQAQAWQVGKIACRTIAYNILGESIGGEWKAATANGTFVGVLIDCTNRGRRTKSLLSGVWALEDAEGRQYAIDTEGSVAFLLLKEDERQKNPEFVELHPGVTTSLALIFDIPESLVSDPSLHLRFGSGKAKFRLVF